MNFITWKIHCNTFNNSSIFIQEFFTSIQRFFIASYQESGPIQKHNRWVIKVWSFLTPPIFPWRTKNKTTARTFRELIGRRCCFRNCPKEFSIIHDEFCKPLYYRSRKEISGVLLHHRLRGVIKTKRSTCTCIFWVYVIVRENLDIFRESLIYPGIYSLTSDQSCYQKYGRLMGFWP